jgi:hypothetical protein
MTNDGIYNTQNKAHRRRLLGYTGNVTQIRCNPLRGLKMAFNTALRSQVA